MALTGYSTKPHRSVHGGDCGARGVLDGPRHMIIDRDEVEHGAGRDQICQPLNREVLWSGRPCLAGDTTDPQNDVILCKWARLGLALIKKRNAPMSVSIYFRSLAARCRTSVRDCIDLFAKEEFRKLANEFETRADQLERSALPAAQTDRWLTRREQARGFEGDR
jgi:hypothetical protein